ALGGLPAPDATAIIQTDVIQTVLGSAMFAVALWDSNTSNLGTVNTLNVEMRGIDWRTYPNPQISAVDLGMAANCVVFECLIDSNDPYPGLTEPTHTDVFGLRLPRTNNTQGAVRTENLQVLGYYTCIVANECWLGGFTTCGVCKVGVEIPLSNF